MYVGYTYKEKNEIMLFVFRQILLTLNSFVVFECRCEAKQILLYF